MNLDSLHIHLGDRSAGGEHHLMVLLRKAINDVCADTDVMLARLFDRFQITFGIMGPVDQLGGGIMDRLQAHFHPEIGSLIQLGQVFHDVVRQAIGACSNR